MIVGIPNRLSKRLEEHAKKLGISFKQLGNQMIEYCLDSLDDYGPNPDLPRPFTPNLEQKENE